MTEFIKGLDLNHLFYDEVVAPILETSFPGVRYSAALIGWGSDVLGYDDARSTDHNWGVRFQIFLSERDAASYRQPIYDALDETVPAEFRGYPISFPLVVDEDQRGDAHSDRHNIDVETIEGFFGRYLGCDSFDEITAVDWLTFPEHKLLGVTSGRVFHDGLGDLESIRQKFGSYPKDVWIFMLAAQWVKIFEEQAFVGRCGEVGDELGSMLVAARQVKNLMRLCFLIERTYAPYGKWFGTAFERLECARELGPIFVQVLLEKDWRKRQAHLARSYETVARLHNALNLTIPMNVEATEYYDRPYLVVGDERYPEELRRALTSEEVEKIRHGLGSVSQFVDSDSHLNDLFLCRRLRELYT